MLLLKNDGKGEHFYTLGIGQCCRLASKTAASDHAQGQKLSPESSGRCIHSLDVPVTVPAIIFSTGYSMRE